MWPDRVKDLFWVRVFNPKHPNADGRYVSFIMVASETIKLMREPGCKDVVSLETGEVLRHELKGAIPLYLLESFSRQIAFHQIVTSGKCSVITGEPEYQI